MDVQNEAFAKDAFDFAAGVTGVPTIVVNNAGIESTQLALELPLKEFDSTMDGP